MEMILFNLFVIIGLIVAPLCLLGACWNLRKTHSLKRGAEMALDICIRERRTLDDHGLHLTDMLTQMMRENYMLREEIQILKEKLNAP